MALQAIFPPRARLFYPDYLVRLAAFEEAGLLRRRFRQKYPYEAPERTQLPPQFIQDNARLEGQLACIYAVAGFRERLIDNAILAARADVDAAIEFLADDFIKAWGPRKSAKSAARRAKALADEAAARQQQHIRESSLIWDEEHNGWGSGGGWGDTGTGWGTGDWSGGATGWGSWATNTGAGSNAWNPPATDPPALLKPRRRFPRAWGKVRLTQQPPTFLSEFEHGFRVALGVLRGMQRERFRRLHEVRCQQPPDERRELHRLRRLSPALFF
ncbi:hypothetical protein B0H13DRAFT_2348907 [Mycena leptocephala]|nr:hypothetical protein B0H13DRAFT_2348907 [Mycena leptocephala]